MNLDEYVPETINEGDKLKPSDVVNHPLIIKVLGYRTGINTKYDPNSEAVAVDVFDLSDQKIHLGVLWFNAAIRDNLKAKEGKALPVRLVYQQPKKAGGNPYIIPTGLEGVDLEQARAWATQRPNMFEDERAEREIGPYVQQGATAPTPKEEDPWNPTPTTSAPIAATPPPAVAPPAATAPPAQAPPKTLAPTPATVPAAATVDDEEPPF